MPIKQNKRYLIDDHKLMETWNWMKNNELKIYPDTFTIGSDKKVWWKCSEGHEWESTISNRNYGYGCPYCSKRYAISGENDLQTVNPTLSSEWDYEKNIGIKPSEVLPNSDKRVWWKCDRNHSWQTQIKVRHKGSGCPYCAGQKVWKGFNDFLTINPEVASEWNYDKNCLLPDQYTANSGKKVWWKCSKGHEWESKISHRNSGSGCPYCAGVKVIKGENDLQTANLTFLSEWDYDKNTGIKPSEVLPNSDKRVWWKCSKGHSWNSQVKNRSRGCGCPYCAGRKVWKGFNDLSSVNPELMKEWNFEKNKNIRPENCSLNSSKKVWWKCSKGHEWESTISNRNYGYGCPYCAGTKVIKGENDLQTRNPKLAQEWNYEKNRLHPSDFFANSGKKVWWKCSKGHEWYATIAGRNSGIGCPICSSERHTSYPEFALLYYLKKIGIDVMHSYKEKGYELDIFIPSKMIGIEYDGYYWHKNKKNKELEKNKLCVKDGIKLYRLRENLPSLNDTSIDYLVEKNRSNLSDIIIRIFDDIFRIRVDVDLMRDNISIESLREYSEKEKSISVLNPILTSEWNYDRNGNLKPENYTLNSSKRVWWKCLKGHEWEDKIVNRNKGGRCPFCSNRKLLIGFNDLGTLNPSLTKEWNYEKNQERKPTHFMPSNQVKVWWKCLKGHEWEATIASRNQGCGCPYCSKRYAISGENDLQTLYPNLTTEWDYKKNVGIKPSDVLPNSDNKVWWKCSRGHSWKTQVKHRTKGCGCPYCAGKKVWKGYNDLQTVNAILSKEWNYERNKGLTPIDVNPNSHKKVWWKCSKGHEWEAIIYNRTKGSGCPKCRKKK